MKTFQQWAQMKEAGQPGFMPNLGQQAVPVTQGTPQQQAPSQAPQNQPGKPQQPTSLGSYASSVKDPNWQNLYRTFSTQYQKAPQAPQTQQLGQALHQAATSGNMSVLQPFMQGGTQPPQTQPNVPTASSPMSNLSS